MTTILIIDDHPMMRTALRITMEDQPNLVVVGEAGSVAEGIRLAASLKPDLILLDFFLPDGTGLDVIQFRNEYLPATRVLIMTSSNHEKDIISALEAGANSYVVKDSPAGQFLQAVQSVIEGGAFLTPGATDILLKHIRLKGEELEDNGKPLSPREIEILRILASGAANAEIAGKLDISASTLRTHFQRILKKLGLQNHSQVIVYAVKHFTRDDD